MKENFINKRTVFSDTLNVDRFSESPLCLKKIYSYFLSFYHFLSTYIMYTFTHSFVHSFIHSFIIHTPFTAKRTLTTLRTRTCMATCKSLYTLSLPYIKPGFHFNKRWDLSRFLKEKIAFKEISRYRHVLSCWRLFREIFVIWLLNLKTFKVKTNFYLWYIHYAHILLKYTSFN